MRKRQRRPRPAKSDINVTPFIDILLVLLVIFMTITPRTPVSVMRQTFLSRRRPVLQEAPQDNRAIIISMARDGEIRINRTEVELPELSSKLLEIFKTRNDKTAFIEADTELLFSQIAQEIDVARASGVDRVGLVTQAIGR